MHALDFFKALSYSLAKPELKCVPDSESLSERLWFASAKTWINTLVMLLLMWTHAEVEIECVRTVTPRLIGVSRTFEPFFFPFKSFSKPGYWSEGMKYNILGKDTNGTVYYAQHTSKPVPSTYKDAIFQNIVDSGIPLLCYESSESPIGIFKCPFKIARWEGTLIPSEHTVIVENLRVKPQQVANLNLLPLTETEIAYLGGKYDDCEWHATYKTGRSSAEEQTTDTKLPAKGPSQGIHAYLTHFPRHGVQIDSNVLESLKARLSKHNQPWPNEAIGYMPGAPINISAHSSGGYYQHSEGFGHNHHESLPPFSSFAPPTSSGDQQHIIFNKAAAALPAFLEPDAQESWSGTPVRLDSFKSNLKPNK